ncbi:hypothetical protein [Mangrovimonas sp. TPBH4]|uniref:hypothetical protein n=1 Tax=Mangrovimonas sp. TPBH4 TaxID=1645914 RepID=UPI0006B4B9B9|nr:hypothetical protein [Mangrovimonas sp. TPBH4]
MYPLEDIQENYRTFDDNKIIKIALNESKGLRKEVLPILKKEIERRNLNLNLITWVDCENNSFSEKETNKLINDISNLTCWKCKARSNSVQAFEINTVISLLILCNDSTKTWILCSSCGQSKKWTSLLTTLFLGWWSKKGIFLTPYTLIKDITNLFFQNKKSDKMLRELIKANTGTLRSGSLDDTSLEKFVATINEASE